LNTSASRNSSASKRDRFTLDLEKIGAGAGNDYHPVAAVAVDISEHGSVDHFTILRLSLGYTRHGATRQGGLPHHGAS
jgi:hypothetical protein